MELLLCHDEINRCINQYNDIVKGKQEKVWIYCRLQDDHAKVKESKEEPKVFVHNGVDIYLQSGNKHMTYICALWNTRCPITQLIWGIHWKIKR